MSAPASPAAERTPIRRVVVADDEPLARERLRQLLARFAGWQVVAEARNGAEAVDAILEHAPDVVFLDVRMPALDGVEVAEAVAPTDDAPDRRAPVVVFVSAHDEAAVRAFDVNAVDYLLKPVDRERFARTLARVETRLAGGARTAPSRPGEEVSAVLAGAGTPAIARRFLIRTARGYHFVHAADVEWVGAEGNYAALHAGGRAHLVRQTMKALEARLDPAVFARVHRSAIVNVTRIARVEPLGHGEYRLHLASGARVETGRAYGARVQSLLRA